MKQIIITVKYDVTSLLPNQGAGMDDQEIIEYIGDSPELLEDADLYATVESPYIVKKVERV